MPLDEYRKKRDFGRTPEPQGGAGSGEGLAYVIQKHDASHLHYDFRLELDGVMLSWAVPKGPSLDPSEKRLAMRTEDHPMDYRHFEGVIPKGEYGGGTVMVWDRGTWEPDGDARAMLRSGKLEFALHGERLRGGWRLIRTRGRGDERESWLLMKADDDVAMDESETRFVEGALTSVATGRTMAEIARERDRVWSSRDGEVTGKAGAAAGGKAKGTKAKGTKAKGAKAKGTKAEVTRTKRSRAKNAAAPSSPELDAAPKSKLPTDPAPMLAKLATDPPTGDDWLHEMKFDGYRILARLDDGAVSLITRGGKDWADRYPPVTKALERWTDTRALLDGEVVVLMPDGTTSFQAMQNYQSGVEEGLLVYYVFDLLHLDGHDLTRLPLVQRKELLRALLDAHEPDERLRFSDHVAGQGKAFFDNVCEHGLEGIISKRADSRYSASRSGAWVKVKCVKRQEFVVAGFTDPSGSRTGFGALVLGYHDDGALHYAGRVGTGFDEATLERLSERLERLETKERPFAEPLPARARAGVHWIRPELVAEVAYTEWTEDGSLRHPSFLGLREDKDPQQVGRERAAPATSSKKATGARKNAPATSSRKATAAKRTAGAKRNAAATSSSEKEADVGHGVTISNPQKVMYPDAGVTKGEIAAYYEKVGAEWVLPHLRDRPLTLLRCPDGIAKECFYQKHGGKGTPDTVPRVDVGDEEPYLYVDSHEALMSLVQLGVLEFHTWNATVDDLERADQLVFDLDPGPGLDFGDIVAATRDVGDRLRDLGLVPFVKTTGGKGIHVVVPLVPQHDWEITKAFAKAFAVAAERERPKDYTSNMSKARRGGRIFIDYLRNGRDATQVAAYSTRARPGANVSVPLRWDELTPSLDPKKYDIASVPRRLGALKEDPWADFEEGRRELTVEMVERMG